MIQNQKFPSLSKKIHNSNVKKLGHIYIYLILFTSFPGGSDGKVSDCNEGDLGLTPGLGRSPGEGNGNPLQYSCLENPTDGGARQATVHGVAKSQIQF